MFSDEGGLFSDEGGLFSDKGLVKPKHAFVTVLMAAKSS